MHQHRRGFVVQAARHVHGTLSARQKACGTSYVIGKMRAVAKGADFAAQENHNVVVVCVCVCVCVCEAS